MSLAMVVLFPLTLAGSTFVDPHTMPGWLHAHVDANPATHLVTTVRDATAGTAALGQVCTVLLASATPVTFFGPLTMHAYRTRQ